MKKSTLIDLFSRCSKQAFLRIKDTKGYHNKSHGLAVAKVAKIIARGLDLPHSDQVLVEEAARWHDVACLLQVKYKFHEPATVNFIKGILTEKNNNFSSYFFTIADMLAQEKVLFRCSLTDISISDPIYVVEAADYISQCSHQNYIPMLGVLYEQFFVEKKAFARKHNPYKNIEDLFWDRFIYRRIYPKIKDLLDKNFLSTHKEGFLLNKKIRDTARDKKINYKNVVELFKEIQKRKEDYSNWNEKFDPTILCIVLEKLMESSGEDKDMLYLLHENRRSFYKGSAANSRKGRGK